MLYAFARDGFGPNALAHIHAATGGPRRATWLVVIVAVVVNLVCGAIGWPDMGTGNDAIDPSLRVRKTAGKERHQILQSHPINPQSEIKHRGKKRHG